jgi:tetratricopeptide (TPR) repeat protein
LDEFLKSQARDKFCQIFSWREGSYSFAAGKSIMKELTPVDISVAQLCLRGVRQYYNLDMIRTFLAPYLHQVPRFRKGNAFSISDFRLATWDLKVLPALHEGQPLATVLEKRVARDIDVYHLFFTFLMLGVLEYVDAPQKNRSEDSIASPFLVLGVRPNATDDQVRKAFETKMGELDTESKRRKEEKRLRSAYEAIGSIQGRRDYLMRLYEESGKLPKVTESVFQPYEFIEIGRKFLDKSDFARARQVFLDGVAAFPEEGLLYSYLGQTMIQQSSGVEKARDYERGRRMMIHATQLAPDRAETHLMLGEIFLREKDYEKGAKAFRKAISLSAHHPVAEEKLKICQRAMEKSMRGFFKRRG